VHGRTASAAFDEQRERHINVHGAVAWLTTSLAEARHVINKCHISSLQVFALIRSIPFCGRIHRQQSLVSNSSNGHARIEPSKLPISRSKAI
jgi:hypothetical protein